MANIRELLKHAQERHEQDLREGKPVLTMGEYSDVVRSGVLPVRFSEESNESRQMDGKYSSGGFHSPPEFSN